MEAVLSRVNALVVMPTGSGKSLCYQLPACAMEGTTLVISPLIALMKDQVDALTQKHIPATFINSSVSAGVQQDRLHSMEQGAYKVVYVAPERFRSASFCRAIAHTHVSLLAIDEAHCISQWGHDFRPDYLRLAQIRDQLGHPPTIALTATATSQVQRDILTQLNLPEAEIFVYGFERPNLFFEVHDTRSKSDKIERILALMQHHKDQGALIYGATRKQVEEITTDLRAAGIQAGMYHGGLSDGERAQVQDAYMRDEFKVLVATNAFGMGVDKSNIRVIVHYNIPGSIEAYYQEAGRAGRDGLPSHCLMLFNYADRGIHDFFNEQSYPDRATVERVWQQLKPYGLGTHALGAEQLTQHINRTKGRRAKRINSWAVETCLRQLQRAEHLEFGTRDGIPWLAILDQASDGELRVEWEYLEKRRDINDGLLADVTGYASGRSCRQLYLLRYFNSRPSFSQGCGHCDVCTGPPAYATLLLQDIPPASKIQSKDTLDLLTQKVLSGVARAQGRFGAHLIAGALRGARSKKLLGTSLPRTSTYGLLKGFKQDDLVSLLDLFLRHDLLARSEHGCLGLTSRGKEVMLAPGQMSPALRQALEAMVHVKTQSTRPSRTPSAPATAPAAAPTPTEDDTYTQTLTLLSQGLSYTQVARTRGMKSQSILRHMMVLGQRGVALPGLTQLLDRPLLEAVRQQAKNWEYGDELEPLKASIPVSCTYDDLKLHLAQVLFERHGS